MKNTYQVLTTYLHTQDQPNAVWSVDHYLNTYPTVDVIILNNGKYKKILPTTVEYIDQNKCKITFTDPQTGVAKVS